MAEVTGMTATRALAMEAATIVDGRINDDGHLILTRHDGSEIDAGYSLVAIPDASTTVRGSVELATEAETAAHTDAVRAVTPASLASTIARVTTVEGVADVNRVGQQLVPASYTQASLLSDYPDGVSYLYMSDTQATAGGWSFGGNYGVVVTYKNGGDLAVQTWYYHATGNVGQPAAHMWLRSANDPSGWSPWSPIATPLLPETMGMTGEIKMWPVNTVPNGWLPADGSEVSRATYAALFDILGTTFGVGNGTTTFNVPNMKGRVPVGYDTGQTEFDTVGETGGEKTHVLTSAEMPSHTHVQNSHAHTFQGNGALTDGSTGASYVVNSGSFYGFRAQQMASATAVNQNTGGGGAHNNLQPYMTVRYIIKT